MITEVVKGAGETKAKLGLPNTVYCNEVGVPPSTLRRWNTRMQNGEPLLNTPGPRKVEPLRVEDLHSEVKGLGHRRKLSYGTMELYNKYSDSISRRDLNELVKAARSEIILAEKQSLRRIVWHIPNLAWSMDDLYCDFKDPEGRKYYANRMQDMCSKYKFNPLAGEFPCGEEVAGYLKAAFDKFEPPLFLKRDNRGNLNHPSVNEVLSDYFVIPLNSPTYYAPYNGSIEESQGEFLKRLKEKLSADTACPREHIQAYADAVENDLNHNPRPCLKGKNSCQVYFEGRGKLMFSIRERREIYDWTLSLAGDILADMGGNDKPTFESTWRIAVETWLRQNGYITVTINGNAWGTGGKVSPNYAEKNAH